MLTTLTAPAATHAERFRARRAERAERARLRAELASYRTPSERAVRSRAVARMSSRDRCAR